MPGSTILLPTLNLFISDVLQLQRKESDGRILYAFGDPSRDVDNVKICGIIVEKIQEIVDSTDTPSTSTTTTATTTATTTTTTTVLVVDDGTGHIRGRYVSDGGIFESDTWHTGLYVEVLGQVRQDNPGDIYLLIHRVLRPSDPHAEAASWTRTVQLYMRHYFPNMKRGPVPPLTQRSHKTKEADIPMIESSTPTNTNTNTNTTSNRDGDAGATSTVTTTATTTTTVSAELTSTLLRALSSTHTSGASLAVLSKLCGASEEQTMSALETLLLDGVIYQDGQKNFLPL